MNRIVLLLLAFTLTTACTTTVVPKRIHSPVASFDGRTQNSGVIEKTDRGTVIVTQAWIERYNAMIEVYGGYFYPPLKMNDGAFRQADGNWEVDSAAFVHFLGMNRWRK